MNSNSEFVLELVILPSKHVVDVPVIDSTGVIRYPLGFFVKDVLPSRDTLGCLSFVFVVRHPSEDKVPFDLGLRKNPRNFPPVIRDG